MHFIVLFMPRAVATDDDSVDHFSAGSHLRTHYHAGDSVVRGTSEVLEATNIRRFGFFCRFSHHGSPSVSNAAGNFATQRLRFKDGAGSRVAA